MQDTSSQPPVHLTGPVLRSFFFIRRALELQKYTVVQAMARKYAQLHPDKAPYFEEIAALAHKETGNLEKAACILRKVNAHFDGQNRPVLYNLLNILRECHEYDEALDIVTKAQAYFPDDAVLRLDALRLKFGKGEMQEALDGIRQLCAQQSTSTMQYFLADFSFALGHYAESMNAFEQAHMLNPADNTAWCNHIFLAHYVPTYSQQNLRDILHRYHEACTQFLEPTPLQYLQRDCDPARPLRIGILSSGLRIHPVGWMAARIVRTIAASGMGELYFYNTHSRIPDTSDPFTKIFQEAASQWHHVGQWPAQKLYQRLLADKLDIALDMAGHADGCCGQLFVRRIAPVQIKWVGGLYNTSGIANMDYIFSDDYETPPGVDEHYSEKIIRLPFSYVAYTPPDYGYDVRPVPRLHTINPINPINQGRICFGSFNNSYKINPALVAVWARILHHVPESFIYLKDDKLRTPQGKQRIYDLFAAHGIKQERLLLEGNAPHSELLKCYNRVDIALDTWPYTGGLTTLEALWMGVPVITTPGPSFAGRHALSHLYNVGLKEFVTESFDAYVALAVELAKQPEILNDLRSLLRLRILQSPLVDHKQRAADIQTALRAAWERHCAGLAPIAMRFDTPTPITTDNA